MEQKTYTHTENFDAPGANCHRGDSLTDVIDLDYHEAGRYGAAGLVQQRKEVSKIYDPRE